MQQTGPDDRGPRGSNDRESGAMPLQFGPYVVSEQIGSGGMGAVYRARDSRLHRDVAVKVLHRHLAIAGAHERFLREARAVSSLNHPNICTVFDIGEEGEDPYLVMELLEGVSLRDRLYDGPPILEPELQRIATQAAMALAAAHAKGIVHRDIKPANLFLVANNDGETQLKVLDFGLAKLESERQLYGDSGLTRTGSTVGTVEYMSPEQARGMHLDPRSDLFSLGAVLYELATGDVPFRGPTSAVVFAELLGSDPEPARSSNTALSPGMDSIIGKLLQKPLDTRTQSAQELLSALRGLRPPVSNAAKSAPARSISSPPVRKATPTPVKTPLTPKPAVPPTAQEPIPEQKPRISAELAAAPRHDVAITDPDARAVRQRPDNFSAGVGYRVARSEIRYGDDPFAKPKAAYEEPATKSGSKNLKWILLAVLIVVALAIAGYFLRRSFTPASSTNVITGPLQVTAFQNNTRDASLDDVPATAMQLLLQEMPNLALSPYATSAPGMEPDAKSLAAAGGAAEYLTGDVTRDGQQYRVHAQIVRTADGVTLAQEEADAGSLVELPGAFSRLAMQLRAHMGETLDEANTNTVALETEGSKSFAALADYGHGIAQLRAGKSMTAADLFTKALGEDAVFPAARLKLAEALRQSGAEQERLAAVAALRVDAGSPCERANAVYERAGATSALEAAQRWWATCPHSADAAIALSREQLAAGRSGEAEASANRAVTLDPASRAAYAAATEAMLSQDHFESALKEQQHAAAYQASSSGLTLLAAYLRGDANAEAQASAAVTGSANWSDQWYYVTYLSNRGHLDEATRAGNDIAARMQGTQTVASAAAVMKARLAALRAMAGHCDAGAADSGASERAAYFAVLANAWCHRNVADPGLSDPALAAIARGAQAWGSGQMAQALTFLDAARPGTQFVLAAMLRGEAHLALKQQELAIGDYRAVITRRGAAMLTGTLVYPAAQAGLATTYHSMGDQPNANSVQADLEAIWKDSAPAEPLLRRSTR